MTGPELPHHAGTTSDEHARPPAVHDHLEGHDDGAPTDCDTPSCVQAYARGDRWLGPHCSVEENGRAHFHHVAELHAKVNATQKRYFEQLCEEYRKTPSDFVTAWTYLQNHPLFHRPHAAALNGRTVADFGPGELDEVLTDCHVEHDNGLHGMWMHATRDAAGNTEIWLEHGPYLWPGDVDEKEHVFTPSGGMESIDIELNVVADSYENAVVQLAENVRRRYGDDRSLVTRPHP